MFYLLEVQDHVRVEPKLFGLATRDAVLQQLKETYANYQNKEFGVVISVIDVMEIGNGIIIPGDGAAYYKSTFKIMTWRPELHELTYGIIDEISNFGAFINLGAAKGLIHISQTMEDYVSFNKSNTLTGKTNKKTLKKDDACMARIVAISHKGDEMKIGLTMRQPGLGKLEWIKEIKNKKSIEEKKAAKAEGKTKGGKKK